MHSSLLAGKPEAAAWRGCPSAARFEPRLGSALEPRLPPPLLLSREVTVWCTCLLCVCVIVCSVMCELYVVPTNFPPPSAISRERGGLGGRGVAARSASPGPAAPPPEPAAARPAAAASGEARVRAVCVRPRGGWRRVAVGHACARLGGIPHISVCVVLGLAARGFETPFTARTSRITESKRWPGAKVLRATSCSLLLRVLRVAVTLLRVALGHLLLRLRLEI